MRLVTALRDIDLQPGDVLLLQIDQQVTQEQAEMLKARVLAATGCGALILAGGMRLGDVLADGQTPIYDAVAALVAQ